MDVRTHSPPLTLTPPLLPPKLGRISRLHEYFTFQTNHFEGTVPTQFGRLSLNTMISMLKSGGSVKFKRRAASDLLPLPIDVLADDSLRSSLPHSPPSSQCKWDRTA